MRRLLSLVVLVALASCRANPTNWAVPGATSSELAVKQFLDGARAQDLQAVSAVWGNAESPTRERVDRQELERRVLIMICHLRHDESVIGAGYAGEESRILHRVDIKQGTKSAAPVFTTVRNLKSGRWYVEDLELRVLTGFCTTMPTTERKTP